MCFINQALPYHYKLQGSPHHHQPQAYLHIKELLGYENTVEPLATWTINTAH